MQCNEVNGGEEHTREHRAHMAVRKPNRNACFSFKNMQQLIEEAPHTQLVLKSSLFRK